MAHAERQEVAMLRCMIVGVAALFTIVGCAAQQASQQAAEEADQVDSECMALFRDGRLNTVRNFKL